MKLSINVKPKIVQSRTKSGVMMEITRIGGLGRSWTAVGSSIITSSDGKRVYAYHLEKHRPKSKVYGDGERKLVPNFTMPKKIVKEGHWKAYVYVINAEILKALRITVEQKARNFVLHQK